MKKPNQQNIKLNNYLKAANILFVMHNEKNYSTKKHNISFAFIAYNEEENIIPLVNSAKTIIKKIAKNYEIVFIVLETSKDRTIDIIKELSKKSKNIRLVLQSEKENGTGRAYHMCLENSKYEFVFYSDADNQFDLREIEKFLPFMEQYEIVAGYRIGRKGFSRVFVASIYNIINKALFGVKERDVDCAFRLINKKALGKLRFTCKTGLFTTEMLVKARRVGFKIKEIGVHEYPRKSGKPMWVIPWLNFPKPEVVFKILKEMKNLWIEIYWNKKSSFK